MLLQFMEGTYLLINSTTGESNTLLSHQMYYTGNTDNYNAFFIPVPFKTRGTMGLPPIPPKNTWAVKQISISESLSQ